MDAAMKSAKDSVFRLSYSITQGAEQDVGSRVWSLLSLTVEMLQVVRVITHVTYGWTHASQAMARWFDLVAVVVDQVRQWVPDLYFYILACVLVVVASADSVLITKMTRDGVLAVWPLKVMRFLVATIVTTLFSTTLEFLLHPLDCTPDATTFSDWFHGVCCLHDGRQSLHVRAQPHRSRVSPTHTRLSLSTRDSPAR
ncbi:hypothetical protein T484DRAFT_2492966 [Baffinella frigidus]|nr:hypothetical protein T484DRAFT_2492966 [Cryptophyta sp. CCMP2293]